MPQTTVPGFLYDARGNPVLPGVGNLHKRTEADDRLRPSPRSHFNDFSALLSPRRYQELVTEGRKLGSVGQPSALFDQKADYVAAGHFLVQFLGSDAAYGTAAQPVIEDALRICNLRGPLYDWKTTLRLFVPTLATDGQLYVLLTRWMETNWPAIQILEAHRIGQRDPGEAIVKRTDAFTVTADGSRIQGAYTGLRISKGHIYNVQGTEVAYRVLGATPEEDQDISARDLFRVARPRTFSEDRTPPEIAAAALEFIGLGLAWEAALDQQILDSRRDLIEQNATGKVDPMQQLSGMGRTGSPEGSPTTIEERGHHRIIKTGHSLEAFESSRPSDQYMNFEERGSSRGAAASRWRSEMLSPGKLSGAANRAFQDQMNTLIQESFDTTNKAGCRILGYFASVLASPELGAIANHAETRKWGIAAPPWFEVDRASAKYDLDDVAAGRTSMRKLRARDGHTSLQVYRERALDYIDAQTVSAEFAGKVPLDVIRGDEGVTVQRTGGQGQESQSSPQRTQSSDTE